MASARSTGRPLVALCRRLRRSEPLTVSRRQVVAFLVRCDSGLKTAGRTRLATLGSDPTIPTSDTHSPGAPPGLCVRASLRPRATEAIWRFPASPRSWRHASKSIRSPEAPIGWPKDLSSPSRSEGAGEHLLPRGAARGEAEVLHQAQLGRREAVV